jgi:hypothetical protein
VTGERESPIIGNKERSKPYDEESLERDIGIGRMAMRKTIVFLLVMLLGIIVSLEAYAGENVWYSVFVPGWGQINSGHYGRGALFLSAELVSLTTLVIADIQYNRSVEQSATPRMSTSPCIRAGTARMGSTDTGRPRSTRRSASGR